jgi:diguanylate cyclase (GGDEF)-like protein/PAS domain S-box-containing protein
MQNAEAIKELENAQSHAEERYQLLFTMSMNGMLVVRPNGYTIEEVNQAFYELCGRSQEELVGQSLLDILGPGDRERLSLALTAMADSGRGTLAGVELKHASDMSVWLDISITFVGGTEDRVLLLACKDVSEQRDLHDRLVRIASTDELTGLLNQRSFYSRLDCALGAAVWQGQPLSLVLLDLDNFKSCNDTFGHAAGDDLLRSIGALIRRHVRGADEGFRYGGDEFAVIMKGASEEAAVQASERIQKSYMDTERRGTSMSFGVASFRPGMSSRSFVEAADAALYEAKRQGKNRICTA